MKKKIALMFGVSITLGVSYFVWSYSGIGKKVLAQFIIKKWSKIATSKDQTFDGQLIKDQLAKLNYEDHELLVRHALIAQRTPENDEQTARQLERLKSILIKINNRKIFERADLSSLNNIIFTADNFDVTTNN